MDSILSRIIDTLESLQQNNDYEKIKQLAAYALSLLDPSLPKGEALFNAVARVTVTVALEAVALRRLDGVLQVYLVQRNEQESAYPGQWHCPGSVLRPMESETDVMNRLASLEFGCPIDRSRFVGNFNHQREARGHFFNPLWIVELEGEPSNPRGGWYPVDSLPEPTLGHHRHVGIPAAVNFWRLHQLIPDALPA